MASYYAVNVSSRSPCPNYKSASPKYLEDNKSKIPVVWSLCEGHLQSHTLTSVWNLLFLTAKKEPGGSPEHQMPQERMCICEHGGLMGKHCSMVGEHGQQCKRKFVLPFLVHRHFPLSDITMLWYLQGTSVNLQIVASVCLSPHIPW